MPLAVKQNIPVTYFQVKTDVAFERKLKDALVGVRIDLHKGNLSRPQLNDTSCSIFVITESGVATETLAMLEDLVARNYQIIVIDQESRLSKDFKWLLMTIGVKDILPASSRNIPAEQIASRLRRWKRIDEIAQSALVHDVMIGSSKAWRKYLHGLIEAAHFSTNPILLLGDSGTGKELSAELVGFLSRVTNEREVTLLDCSTIVPELFGSEFYGHEKGAFTNALTGREGAFATADGGVLFLDEIGELPIGLQAGLLRVVQEGTYKKVGGNAWMQSKFRLVSATNKDLGECILKGSFRQDLYYRIAASVHKIPSLEERRSDIPELVHHFVKCTLKSSELPTIDPMVMQYLMEQRYPGNVRELRQLVNRILASYAGVGAVTIGNLPEEEFRENYAANPANDNLENEIKRLVSKGKTLSEIKDEVSNIAVRVAVQNASGSMSQAAKTLDQSVRNLQKIKLRSGTVTEKLKAKDLDTLG